MTTLGCKTTGNHSNVDSLAAPSQAFNTPRACSYSMRTASTPITDTRLDILPLDSGTVRSWSARMNWGPAVTASIQANQGISLRMQQAITLNYISFSFRPSDCGSSFSSDPNTLAYVGEFSNGDVVTQLYGATSNNSFNFDVGVRWPRGYQVLLPRKGLDGGGSDDFTDPIPQELTCNVRVKRTNTPIGSQPIENMPHEDSITEFLHSRMAWSADSIVAAKSDRPFMFQTNLTLSYRYIALTYKPSECGGDFDESQQFLLAGRFRQFDTVVAIFAPRESVNQLVTYAAMTVQQFNFTSTRWTPGTFPVPAIASAQSAPAVASASPESVGPASAPEAPQAQQGKEQVQQFKVYKDVPTVDF